MKARHTLPLPPDMDCGFTAWTPSGVKREKHRAYNRLVSVIQRLCALCFSLLFFVLLKPKFSNETLVYYNHVYNYILGQLSDEEKFTLTKYAVMSERKG